MKKPISEAFSIEKYSHKHVTRDTILSLEKANCRVKKVGEILDIDDRDDIAKALSGDMEAEFHSQGEYNANFLFDHKQKLLRIALDSQLHLGDRQITYEYHALKGLQSSGAVVEVYDLVEKTDLIGKGYLTQEFVPGRPLIYEEDLEIAAELLAQVHAVDPAQLPHLIRADQPFQVMFDEFLSMFSHYQAWDKKDAHVEKIILSMLNDLKKYDMSQPIEHPCVINTELNSGNFIINPEGNSYIIDWEKPLIGEREQDLGHFLAPTTTLWKTDTLLDFNDVLAFVSIYNRYSKQEVNVEKLIQYLQFTCLRGVTWCAMAYVQYLEDEKSKSNDETFQVIQRFIQPSFLENIQEYISEGDKNLEILQKIK